MNQYETTKYTKQWLNHTIQYSISQVSARPTPHYPYIQSSKHNAYPIRPQSELPAPLSQINEALKLRLPHS